MAAEDTEWSWGDKNHCVCVCLFVCVCVCVCVFVRSWTQTECCRDKFLSSPSHSSLLLLLLLILTGRAELDPQAWTRWTEPPSPQAVCVCGGGGGDRKLPWTYWTHESLILKVTRVWTDPSAAAACCCESGRGSDRLSSCQSKGNTRLRQVYWQQLTANQERW